MTRVYGPDFVAIQVRDLERSAAFYERELGLRRSSDSPPGVIAFDTSPIPFAVREPLPGTDLDAGPVGLGVSLSLHADDAQAVHDGLKGHGVSILADPFETPFGKTFVFRIQMAMRLLFMAEHERSRGVLSVGSGCWPGVRVVH